MVLLTIGSTASAADWWVTESAAPQLRAALAELWAEEPFTVTVGLPERAVKFAWDGETLVAPAEGRRQECPDAAQAVLLARSWSRVVDAPGGAWIPALPLASVAPEVVEEPTARRSPVLDVGAGVRALYHEPGAVDGQLAEVGVAYGAVRTSVTVYAPYGQPGSATRPGTRLRSQLSGGDCGVACAHASVPADLFALDLLLDAGPTIGAAGAWASPRVVGGAWGAETDLWALGPVDDADGVVLIARKLRAGLALGGQLDLGVGRLSLETRAVFRQALSDRELYDGPLDHGRIASSSWVSVCGRIRL